VVDPSTESSSHVRPGDDPAGVRRTSANVHHGIVGLSAYCPPPDRGYVDDALAGTTALPDATGHRRIADDESLDPQY
jgi:hypothetical protein